MKQNRQDNGGLDDETEDKEDEAWENEEEDESPRNKSTSAQHAKI